MPLRFSSEATQSPLTLTGTLQPIPEETLAVSINNPANNSTLPAGSQVNLQVIIKGSQSPLSMELWNNGNLIGEFIDADVNTNAMLTLPWIVSSESATLTLVVSTQSGAVAVSNAVTIFPTDPSPGLTVITAQENDSRQSLSEQYDIPLEDVIIDTLPDLDPSAQIPLGTPVNLNLPVNTETILEDTPLPDGFLPSPSPSPEHTYSGPTLSGILSDQGVELSITSNTHENKSFVLYRSDSLTGNYIPIFSQKIEEVGKTYQFTDPIDAGRGPVSYFVLGESDNGAVPGGIFQPDLDFADQVPDFGDVLPTSDGKIHIIDGVGIVYFYASLNHAQPVRVPESGFIQVMDDMVDLNQAFLLLSADADFPIWLDAEVWTWTGETAQQLGSVHIWLEKTILAVCVDAGQRCGGIGSGEFYSRELTEAVANTDVTGGTDFDFPWKTSLTGNPQALVQVSLSPFSHQTDPEESDLVYTSSITGQCTQYGCGSVFTIDFANLVEKPGDEDVAVTNYLPLTPDSMEGIPSMAPEKIPSISEVTQEMLYWKVIDGLKQVEIDSDFYQYGNLILYPIDFYVRVIPTSGGQPSGSPSNTVHITYGPMGTSPTPEYFPTVSPPPQPQQIYTAELVEFTPLIPPSLDWGCVYITAVEPNAFNYGYFEELRQNHGPYCPSAYKGQGEPSWYESLWDFATGAIDWISEKYNELKSEVVSQIAGALDSAGLCNDCEAYISAALSAGMVALGIPPELPDFSKLTDAGIDYLVTEAAKGMGVPCDTTCQDIIRDGIHDLADQMKTQTVTSYANEEEAHRHGKNPLFIPPGVSVEPAKESNWQMASLEIQVSRKPGSENISAAELAEIESSLYVTLLGYNDRTGESYTVFNCWSGGCDLINPSPDCQAVAVPGCPETRQVAAPLEGELFEPTIFTLGGELLPHLQPGETKELTLALIPSTFWIPGHETDTTYSWYDDWGYLYEGGIGKIALDINAMTCLDNISGYPPSCSYTLERTDYWEINLPDTSTWGYNQMWSNK